MELPTCANLGGLHNLCLQIFTYFRPPTYLRLQILCYKRLQIFQFLTTHPPSIVNVNCERPLPASVTSSHIYIELRAWKLSIAATPDLSGF